jgi:putative membrane protein
MKTSSLYQLFSTFVGAMVCLSGALLAEDATVNSSDKSFLTTAYEGGLAEVATGQLGQSKATDEEVKKFAAEMVVAHSKANSELQTLAGSKKVELANEPTLTAKAKARMLDMKSGAEFDKAYMEAMVSDHKDTVKLFEKASGEASDADVKALATKLLPELQHHLAMAEALQGKVGK